MIPRVVNARALDNFRLFVEFSDGKRGIIKLSTELWGPVFEPLCDPAVFAQARVHPELATVVWPTGADLAPEFLYERVTQG